MVGVAVQTEPCAAELPITNFQTPPVIKVELGVNLTRMRNTGCWANLCAMLHRDTFKSKLTRIFMHKT